MTDKFSMEELNLIRLYDSQDRNQVISDIGACLPYVYDPALKKVMLSAVEKLKDTTDGDFSEIMYPPNGEYNKLEV